MTTDNKRKFIINFVYFLIVIAIAYFIFKYAIGFLMPFLVAYVISAMLRPLARLIEKRTKIKYKIASLLVVIFFYCTVGAIVFVICAEIFSFSRSMIMKLPGFYSSTLEPMLKTLLGGSLKLPDDFDPTIASALNSVSSNLLGYVGNVVAWISSAIGSYVSTFAMSLPSLVLKIIFSIVSSFYFTADYDHIHGFIRKQFGDEGLDKFDAARRAIRDIIFSYIKSYAIILGITFVELTVALLILRIPGAVLFALLIAVFDILPVVGTGTILIPWAVVELINGRYGMAIGLIITYIVIFIIRNIIEPKIVGEQVGLHPLVTLLAMFVGTMLFGVIGLFGIPITMALIVDLNDKGIIKIFNK